MGGLIVFTLYQLLKGTVSQDFFLWLFSFWVRYQHPPTQWSLRGADDAVMNNAHKNKNPKNILKKSFQDALPVTKLPLYIWVSENGY